ncbi:MAG: hypothetical protein QOG84_2271 [Sphingomonadales bacterium]|jgi:hypothetical protein|nr:hypothetical protein [Sphingomonadales bacterium]
MSHIVGTVQTVSPAIHLGPDAGPATDGPDTWTLKFQHVPAPSGTKLLILHFASASLPGNNRLEVDLGYDGADSMDVFTSANGADFWTRPINVAAFADKKVPIRYIRDGGGATGSVVLDKYGRGEGHSGDPPKPGVVSNCDPFLLDSPYLEPTYDPLWFCAPPPDWENVAKIPAGDLRRAVSRSVGMIIHVDKAENLSPQIDILSTCSVTLIGPDLVITAGHCMADADEHARSSSVIFNYETDENGNRAGDYKPRFFKVKKVIAQHWDQPSGGVDYCLFQLEVPPGLPPIQLRHDIPGAGEQIFGLHHPNGAVKKLSIPHGEGFATVTSSDSLGVRASSNVHVSGGSSGSGLFDAAGRIVGVLADGAPCSGTNLRYYPSASILEDVANPPVDPPASRDVMIVFDRSGSMGLAGASGRPKIDEARDAASLFIQLIRTGSDNHIGLVSFSTTPNLDFSRHTATTANKQALIGPPPFTTKILAGLHADGATAIGDGLKTAAQQLPAGGANPRTLLLLTDGLENTGPKVGDMSVQSAISGFDIDAIGYGADGDLDGNLLTSLAQAHNGRYARADSSLQLEKYFSQAFGNIFEAGLLADPEFVLPADQRRASPFTFNVCGEERITIVVGWDNVDASLLIEVHTPGGSVFTEGTPGTDSSTGRTWTFLKVPLPHAGERDGQWQVVVYRPGGGGEFPPPEPETRYFVNVIASGGPRLGRALPATRFYTGDKINPIVFLSYGRGRGSPDNARVKVTIKRPVDAAGNLLARAGLKPPVTIGGDTIPARQATLRAIAQQTGKPPIAYASDTYELFASPADTGGVFEPDGVYGHPFDDLLKAEGEYSFHCVATYGEGCVSSRELQWTVHVEPGVDPGRTGVDPHQQGTAPGGAATGVIVLTPRDPYGNLVGPGRGDGLTLTGGSGTTIAGDPVDNGDGTYTVPAQWDPGTGPVVVVGQPDRPPVVVTPPAGGGGGGGDGAGRRCWWCMLLCLLLFLLLLVLLLLLWK